MSFKGRCSEHGTYRVRGEDRGCPFCRLRVEWAEVNRQMVQVFEDFKVAVADWVRAIRGIKWD